MTPEQRRPAVGLLVGAALLGVVGLLLADERLRALCWILAAPMALSGALSIAWGNLSAEVRRLRSGDEET